IARQSVEGRLVAPAQLRRAPEQLPFYEIVRGLARAKFLRTRRFAFRGGHVGQLVLVGISAGGEVSDHQHQQDQARDQANRRPIELAHGLLNAVVPLRLHYSSRPSWSRTTRSMRAAMRSLWV